MQPLLWDTFTAIWIYEKARLSPAALEAMRAAYREGVPSYISPITAWEVALLASRGRLQLLIRPERWFSNLFEVPGVRLAEMSPDVLIASSYLPGKPPKDPTDRIMAATARELGATLITRDRALLDYGAQGHVAVLEC
ncbi:MAG TPA: type II toxin-antitoxin system VapC family toxin [Xanthobacteraceae bacterium]|jgi:PIN domain nuclease of toxin-antitoxin system|nr:type II toxin-antitoxin system VapC family toxin [Xanthobacteraceae bacterium]HWZ38086.1 type II toxin-antitoxin system VapC family toxin [Bradyrhizobium sp.]